MELNRTQKRLIKKDIIGHHSEVDGVRFMDGYVEVRRDGKWTTHDTEHGAYSQALLDNYYEGERD